MAHRRETLNVAVENQILWIGAEAYPVRNIARAHTITITPERGKAVLRFFGYSVLWIALAVAAAIAMDDSLPFIVAGVLILISLIVMIRRLATRSLYALIIETSGSPHAALVMDHEAPLHVIVRNITDAINNPHASYGPVTVQNIKVGKAGIIGDHGRIDTMNT